MKLRAFVLPLMLMLCMWTCNAQAQKTVKLTWSAPAATNGVTVTGYRLYRSTTAGTYTTPLTTTNATTLTFTDSSVNGNTKYFYVVRTQATCDQTVDCSQATVVSPGVFESGNSNEITVDIPKNVVAIPSPGQLAGAVQ